MAEHSFNRGWRWRYAQATTRCIINVCDIFTLDCSISWFFVYKTKATRPRPELQDQDQTAAHKTKTKTSFCWSETGLVTRPRSQTTSLIKTANQLQQLQLQAVHKQKEETFKIIRKIYDKETVPKLTSSSIEYTKGHQHKLLNKSVRYDIRKYYFTKRIVNIWNSLPDAVVNSSAINQFKNRLDRHWSKQEIMYDYKAELAGILSRSNI